MNGEIVKLISVRGYGFVRGEDGSERFLQVQDLVETHIWPQLRVGQRVEFEPILRAGGKGNGLGVRGLRVMG